MIQVIVVPETEEFTNHVSHENVVWITKRLGEPNIEGKNARYLAPYWLHGAEGVNRVYHILDVRSEKEATTFVLGNSFILKKNWTSMGQHRRFEYHSLQSFGYVQICPGLLTASDSSGT